MRGLIAACALAACATVLCGAETHAEKADVCAVPGYLMFGDSPLERVKAAVTKDKSLKILVLGTTSSTLPGAEGAKYAYPARLEAALRRRLPGVAVTVVTAAKPRQSASEMTESRSRSYYSTKSRTWCYGKLERSMPYAASTQKNSVPASPTASRRYRQAAQT